MSKLFQFLKHRMLKEGGSDKLFISLFLIICTQHSFCLCLLNQSVVGCCFFKNFFDSVIQISDFTAQHLQISAFVFKWFSGKLVPNYSNCSIISRFLPLNAPFWFITTSIYYEFTILVFIDNSWYTIVLSYQNIKMNLKIQVRGMNMAC